MANAGKVIGKGVTIELEGNVYRVDDFQHVKPGKGAAFIRTRLKNIKTGGVVEKTFRPTEDVETAHVDRSEKQYLYNDGDLYYFMDTETYDQIALSADAIGDALKFVKENVQLQCLPTTEISSQLSRRCSLNLLSQRQSQVSKAIQQQVLQNRQLLRQVLLCTFRYS